MTSRMPIFFMCSLYCVGCTCKTFSSFSFLSHCPPVSSSYKPRFGDLSHECYYWLTSYKWFRQRKSSFAQVNPEKNKTLSHGTFCSSDTLQLIDRRDTLMRKINMSFVWFTVWVLYLITTENYLRP